VIVQTDGMTTTWTLVFRNPAVRDQPGSLTEAVNGTGGLALQNTLLPGLAKAGWAFGEPFAEDYGWMSDMAFDDEGKKVALALVCYPESETLPDGRAEDDRWRVVFGMDIGLFPKTRARRTEAMARLARAVEAEIRATGGEALEWENGPLAQAAA
jgi:hypothetical protein